MADAVAGAGLHVGLDGALVADPVGAGIAGAAFEPLDLAAGLRLGRRRREAGAGLLRKLTEVALLPWCRLVRRGVGVVVGHGRARARRSGERTRQLTGPQGSPQATAKRRELAWRIARPPGSLRPL